MFSSFSLPFSTSLLGGSSKSTKNPSGLSPVKTYDTETGQDKRTKRLQSLLKLNHANHSIIYNNLQFHNHAPHILGSAYILGATPEQLNTIYDDESASLEPWKDSPGEISKDDWRDFLGKRDYQRAFLDFFEDQLVEFGYNWRKMIEYYLYEGTEPLINSFLSGLAHPIIHLGYALELNSRTVAMEALTMGSCFYDSLHKYIDDPSYARYSSYRTTDPAEIIERVASDTRLDGLFEHRGSDNIEPLLEEHEDIVLDHWNAWEVKEANLNDRLRDAQKLAVALLVATKQKDRKYDFFLCHILTSSHAIRILLPQAPASFYIPLVRQWFLFLLLAYIGQLRPKVDRKLVTDFMPKEGEESWKYVQYEALNGQYKTDAHWVKALRAMMVADETWGDQDDWWRKAACRLAADFDGWGGFDEDTTGYQPL